MTPKELKQIKTDCQLGLVRFSPCGRLLCAGALDGTIRRWDASTDALEPLAPIRGHGGWVQAIALASGGTTGSNPPGSSGLADSARQPTGADRLLFAADSWGTLAAWPYADAEPAPAWTVRDAHDGWIRSLAVSPDSTRIATCGRDQRLRLWSTRDGSMLGELRGHDEDIFCVAFHPDGRSLVSGDLKGIIKHWELETGTCLRELDAAVLFKLDRLQDVGGVRALGFDPSGTMLATAGTVPKVGGNVQGRPTVLLFDWITGMKKHTLTLGGDGDGFVYDMQFHRDGYLMAVTSGNPGAGKFLLTRPRDKEPFFVTTKMPNCHSVALHPDGVRVAVTATNGGSNGNGRQLDKDGQYPGNWSPVHILALV